MPTLSFPTPPTHRAIAPDPVPCLWFGANPDLTRIGQAEPPYVIFDRHATLTLGGVRFSDVEIQNAPATGQQYNLDTSFPLNLGFPLYRHLIDLIESRRTDDLSGILHVDIVMSRIGAAPEQVGADVAIKFSEKEWVQILRTAGYATGWTAYIERGRIEGWTEVAEHVSKAHDRLLARDPTGVLVECRAALRFAEKFVTGDWPDISAQIDRGSTPEAGYKNKSERVEALREWVLKMADTGAHAESYNATPEDADVVYGMTVDLLAYLSRKEAHAQRSRKV